MKRVVKIGILLVVLTLPGIFFIFLKKYGRNNYAIPIQYEQGITLAGCDNNSAPFQADTSLLRAYDIQLPALFYFDDGFGLYNEQQVEKTLLSYEAISVYKLTYDSLKDVRTGRAMPWQPDDLNEFINCVLVMGEDTRLSEPVAMKVVLLDRERHIRGYYQVKRGKELERLGTELAIFVKYEL